MSRAVILVDHGSRRDAANEQLERVAEGLRARLGDVPVEIAHMEIVTPDLDTALEACHAGGATEIIVIPYFLAPGRHTAEDLPGWLCTARERHPNMKLRLAPALGYHEKLVEVVFERFERTIESS